MTSTEVHAGAEPLSHEGSDTIGVLVLHGFTGNPSSVRGLADVMVAEDHHVEMPRLPGHGTTVEEMFSTGWTDWADEALAAHDRLAERAGVVVVMGLSMGGTLALWTALRRRTIAGIVCVNPLTIPPADEILAMVDEMIDDGDSLVPGVGSDIADPDSVDIAYDGTPLIPLRSLLTEGVVPLTDRFGELRMPLRLFTSRRDHVVEPANSEHLAATYGGAVDHTWLERSYHVATLDFDRHAINVGAVAFVDEVTGAER